MNGDIKMIISDSVKYVGVNDHVVDLFEGQYDVPLGMAYNSYVILDDKIAVVDTVEKTFGGEWLENIEKLLGDRTPDYLIVQHMEPDHSSSIVRFMNRYPAASIVSSAKAFTMLKNFYGEEYFGRRVQVGEGSSLDLGAHKLSFITAPMVHWPEVIMTYDATDAILFSADAFGKFGANDVEDPEGWTCEARRYYFGIVGKYGLPVQTVLKKAAALNIDTICPLHGPVLTDTIPEVIEKYKIWSSYGVESDGVVIAYTTVYGNTRKAAEALAESLKTKGCPKVVITDLAREDTYEAVENAFRYGKLVLATTTYNGGIFPIMKAFIDHLVERGYKNRTIAFIENGSWAPMAAREMAAALSGCKGITYAQNSVRILSGVSAENLAQIEALASELC